MPKEDRTSADLMKNIFNAQKAISVKVVRLCQKNVLRDTTQIEKENIHVIYVQKATNALIPLKSLQSALPEHLEMKLDRQLAKPALLAHIVQMVVKKHRKTVLSRHTKK